MNFNQYNLGLCVVNMSLIIKQDNLYILSFIHIKQKFLLKFSSNSLPLVFLIMLRGRMVVYLVLSGRLDKSIDNKRSYFHVFI